jgi:pimeloyl-ACP methyl ester carboxylesterase
MNSLLLLHGAIGAKDQLLPLAEILKNNFDVHTISFSGHGGEPLPTSFNIEKFADDVLTYLKQKNISKTTIFGYSMGGYVALYLAKHHPDKIEKVITLATKFDWTPEIAAKEIKMLNPEKIAEKIPAFAASLEKRHQPNDWKMVLQKTADMMVTLGDNNTLKLPDYNTISIPVLLMIGDEDNMVTLTETQAVCNNIPNGKLIVLKNTQHPIEKVDVAKLGEELNAFF